ncbi:hypothetical protein HNQ94_001630 [Salirhabdus euzebyi]|uniref:DUF4179 domain-containing protein n=1 Tax=Salirhabdus euzebyi TaxID=394506 RepID=A0A841Q4A0_9BACI|nr:DUF4179 domain-containing protein [Salirhabdus euzebyi]MBB6453182.1 hypothetical protein [Salirhabdus euzebyi]
MEKWEKELINKVNTAIPDLVDERINITLKQLPRKKRTPKSIYFSSIAAATIFLLFGLSYLSTPFANTMGSLPVIGSVFEMVGTIGEKKGFEQGLTTYLGEEVEIKDQYITFTESLYDGGSIHIGFIVHNHEEGKAPERFLQEIAVYINGEAPSGYGMGVDGKVLEDGTYIGTINIELDSSVPDSFMLGLGDRDSNSLYVELPVEKQGESESFLVNETKKWKDQLMLYKKVTFFPTSTEITYQTVMNEDEFQTHHMDVIVYDDQGRLLQPFSGGGSGGGPKDGKITQEFSYHFEPFDTIPKSLTIKPILSKIEDYTPDLNKKKWEGNGFTLSQGEIGSVKIINLKEESETVTLQYEVQGGHTYDQVVTVWLEDANGNYIGEQGTPLRVEGSVNQYEATFTSVDSTKDIYVVTAELQPIEFVEELEVTIDLNRSKWKE